jgi:Ubiquitinol-cytochrome C reductase Fe-S subunit TAT signal
MPDITRRHFLRNASLGAAAVGAAAVVGPAAFSSATASGEAKHQAGSQVVQPAAAPQGPAMVAEIVDASTGSIAIYVGTRKVNYVNRDIAQQLLKAAQ